MSEITTPILSRMDAVQREALRRYMADKGAAPTTAVSIGEGDALRELAAEALAARGYLPPS